MKLTKSKLKAIINEELLKESEEKSEAELANSSLSLYPSRSLPSSSLIIFCNFDLVSFTCFSY